MDYWLFALFIAGDGVRVGIRIFSKQSDTPGLDIQKEEIKYSIDQKDRYINTREDSMEREEKISETRD